MRAIVPLVLLLSVLCPRLSPAAAFADSSAPPCIGWNQAGAIVMHGRTTGGGLDGSVTRTVETKSGRWSEKIEYEAFSVASGFDGVSSWSQDRSGAAHKLDSAFARKTARSESWVARRGWCSPHGAATEPPVEKIEGGHAYSVSRVTPEGGATIELWIDKSTGLPYRVIEQLSENHQSRTFAAWTVLANGASIAMEERIEQPEEESSETMTFTAVERVASPAARTFAQPAPARDSSILRGARSTTVAYEGDVDRVLVPVTLDGKGPFLFELDTGGHLILTADAANELALKPVGAFTTTGGGQGVIKSGFVKIHELRIGEAVIHEQPAKVLPLSPASNDRGPRPPRSGILGLELFERFAVHLDRRAHTLTLTPLNTFRHKGRGIALQLEFTEDAPLTAGAIGGISGTVELDTGNAGPAILEGHWAAEHDLAGRFSGGVIASGSGVGGEYRTTVNRAALALGPFPLPGELVSYVGVVARGSESVRELAANFGEPILSQFDITFDYGHGVAWLDPLPDRKPREFNRAGIALARTRDRPFTVATVIAGSPAERAGFRKGDVVTAVDGRPASALAAFDTKKLFLQPAGTVVMLTVQEPSGETRNVALMLEELVR